MDGRSRDTSSSREAVITASGPSPPRFYHPELDAVRFLAFLAVYAFHSAIELGLDLSARDLPWYSATWWIRNVTVAGAFSVDLFFTLSSFLITALLLREVDARGRLDVRAFWMRRLLRIWPLYFAFLFAASAIQGTPARYVAAFALFLGNWADIAWGPTHHVIAPLWSVSFEEQFYAVWPLLLFVLPPRRLGLLCVGMIGLSVIVRARAMWLDTPDWEIWFNTFARLDPIAVGALVALLVRRRRTEPTPAGRAGLVVAAGAIYLWGAYRLPLRLIRAEAVAIYVAIALACGALLIATMTRRRSPLALPPLVYLGRISYGLYVFHIAGLKLFAGLWGPWQVALGLAFTVAAASLSYRYLEGPFLRLKGRFTHVPSAPVVVSAVPERVTGLTPEAPEGRT